MVEGQACLEEVLKNPTLEGFFKPLHMKEGGIPKGWHGKAKEAEDGFEGGPARDVKKRLQRQ